MQSIELAMLFSHAGFNVNSILLDNAEKHISSELLKEVTEHSPWSNTHKPNWVKADIKYPVCVIIEPSVEFQEMVLAENSGEASSARNGDNYASYIKSHCNFIKILQREEMASHSISNDLNKQIITLPNNPLKLRSLFEKLLSETVTLTAAKALDGNITYSFEGDFSKIDYVKELEKAFAEGGIEKISINYPLRNEMLQKYCKEDNLLVLRHPSVRHSSDISATCSHPVARLHAAILGGSPQVEALKDVNIENSKESLSVNEKTSNCKAKIIIFNGKKEIEVVFEANEAEIEPTESIIFVSKHKNGLLLTDKTETRLLPDFTCHSCYSRFVTYLKVSLTRKNRGDNN